MTDKTDIFPRNRDAIRDLAHVLAFYADRLALMRMRERADASLTRGYLCADDTGMAYRSISPWYAIVEPLYAELEQLMQQVDDIVGGEVLLDPAIMPLAPKLHRIRAAYEFDKEMAEARLLLASDNASEDLSEMIKHQSYWTLSPPVIQTLNGARNVAVVGSGPLPLTALTLAAETDCHITCFERDVSAFELGNEILALSPFSDRITCLNESTTSSSSFSDFDVIFSAVLMGVSLEDEAHWPKAESIRTFFQSARPNLALIMRDPYRLGALFYPPAEIGNLSGVTINRFDPDAGPGLPYRSSFLILKEC